MEDESMVVNSSETEEIQMDERSDATPLSFEFGLYLLAVAVALIFRLTALGKVPLSSTEAEYAWQAYQVSQGEQVQLLSHPAYILLTGALFFIFSAGDVLARLLPVLVGSGVVLLPMVFRRQLGSKAALVAAFGLAIDPLMVALSRQAGSPLMAVGFAAFGLWMWQSNKPLAAGVFAALCLLSGPSAVLGLLIFLLAAVFLYSPSLSYSNFLRDHEANRRFLFGVGFAMLAFGTLFMRYPQGLAAMLQAIPDYFSGWLSGTQSPIQLPYLRALVALPVYSPLAVLFGVIALINRRTWQEPGNRLFILWLFFALLFGMTNPGRQIADLAWAIIPLWFLAAMVLARYIRKPVSGDRVLVWVGSLFILVLLFYWLMNLSMMTTQYAVFFPPDFKLLNFNILDEPTKLYFVRLMVSIFIPLLVLLLTAVVSTGWDSDTAFQISTWGVGAFLLFYLVAAAWGFTDDRTELAGEFWMPESSPGYIEEMLVAVVEASYQIEGTQTGVDLVYQIDSPLIHWVFRDFPKAKYQPVLDSSALPSVVIGADPSFSLTEQGQFYRGQRAAYQIKRSWIGSPLPPDFDRWLLYRESPVEKDFLYIWTRADLVLFSAPDPSPDTGQ